MTVRIKSASVGRDIFPDFKKKSAASAVLSTRKKNETGMERPHSLIHEYNVPGGIDFPEAPKDALVPAARFRLFAAQVNEYIQKLEALTPQWKKEEKEARVEKEAKKQLYDINLSVRDAAGSGKFEAHFSYPRSGSDGYITARECQELQAIDSAVVDKLFDLLRQAGFSEPEVGYTTKPGTNQIVGRYITLRWSDAQPCARLTPDLVHACSYSGDVARCFGQLQSVSNRVDQ